MRTGNQDINLCIIGKLELLAKNTMIPLTNVKRKEGVKR